MHSDYGFPSFSPLSQLSTQIHTFPFSLSLDYKQVFKK